MLDRRMFGYLARNKSVSSLKNSDLNPSAARLEMPMTDTYWYIRARETLARYETLVFVALPALTLSAVFIDLVIPLMHMFLLDEYRQWVLVFYPDHLQDYIKFPQVFDLSGTSAYFNIAASRGLSYWTSFLFGEMCGPLPLCHNILHLLIVLGAAACSVLTVRKLSFSGSALPLLVTGAVILISVPAVDSLSWQATILDKLAMLFTSVGLLIAASLKIENLKRVDVVVGNVALLVATFAAYNSKEAAFFGAPAAAMLIGCRALAAGVPFVRSIGRACLLTTLPLLYACGHIALVFYNRLIVRSEEFSRVTGGNIGDNAKSYAEYILNLYGFDVSLRTLIGSVAVLSLVVATAAWMSRKRFPVPLPLWAAIAFLASLAIALKTAVGAAFYLLVPMVYFGLLLGFAVDAVIAMQRTWSAKAAVMVIALVFLGVRAEAIRSVMPWYKGLAERSDNFQHVLRTIRTSIAGDLPNRIIIVQAVQDDRAYLLTGAVNDSYRALAPYLLVGTASAAERSRLDKSVVDVAPGTPHPPARAGDLNVFLGPLLQLDHMTRTPK